MKPASYWTYIPAVVWGALMGMLGYILILYPSWLFADTHTGSFWDAIFMTICILPSIAISIMTNWLMQKTNQTRKVLMLGYGLWALLLPAGITLYLELTAGFLSPECLERNQCLSGIIILSGPICWTAYLMPIALLLASLTLGMAHKLIAKSEQ
jgi:hypothetical protein